MRRSIYVEICCRAKTPQCRETSPTAGISGDLNSQFRHCRQGKNVVIWHLGASVDGLLALFGIVEMGFLLVVTPELRSRITTQLGTLQKAMESEP